MPPKRMPTLLLLVLGCVHLGACAYVQKGDENQVEIGHSPIMTSFDAVKAKAEAHCAEFKKNAILQAAISSDDTLFRCEEGSAAIAPDKTQPSALGAVQPAASRAVATPSGTPPTVQGPTAPAPVPPPGYTYVYPQGGMPYSTANPYPAGPYPQTYVAVPPGYMPVPGYAQPQYAPAQSADQQSTQASRRQRRQSSASTGGRASPVVSAPAGAITAGPAPPPVSSAASPNPVPAVSQPQAPIQAPARPPAAAPLAAGTALQQATP